MRRLTLGCNRGGGARPIIGLLVLALLAAGTVHTVLLLRATGQHTHGLSEAFRGAVLDR
jgi:hypothetical protein